MKISNTFKEEHYKQMRDDLKKRYLSTQTNIQLNNELLKEYLRNKGQNGSLIEETKQLLEARRKDLRDTEILFSIISENMRNLKAS